MKDKGINEANELKTVDFITGADLMIRKEALDKAGLFDERFFMYSEESELQFRIKKQGYKTYIVPDAKIIHLHDKSPKKQEKMYFEFLKSKYLLFKLCYGTKTNLSYIKLLIICQTASKFFRHKQAIINLYKYMLNDKIGDEEC